MAEKNPEKDKDYGLPKVDPQPIQRDQPPVTKEPVVAAEDTREKNRWPLVAILSILGVLLIGFLIYVIFTGDSEIPDNPSTPEDRVVMEPEQPTDEPEAVADAEDSQEEPAIIDEPGTIVTISERTNRYYIFVGSYKFRAYAHRHAEKLAADGFAVKLIAPDNWVGLRVAVGNYANTNEASADAQEIRSKYGNEVIISKY